MLAHQLSFLPSLDSFWDELSPFFSWLEGKIQEKHFVEISDKDKEIFQPGRVEGAFSIDVITHKIQFAAANRVCIEVSYNDKKRIVEPLSFRVSKNRNKLFYGYERNDAAIKCFTLSKIKNVDILNLTYKEKMYPVEINASGPIVMPCVKRKKRLLRQK